MLLMLLYMEYILYINYSLFFFFNDTATTEIYTLSLHDALPISWGIGERHVRPAEGASPGPTSVNRSPKRSDEHTSELQSHSDLVCRILLEQKKRIITNFYYKKQKKSSINNHL